jgi:hypothetical protein
VIAAAIRAIRPLVREAQIVWHERAHHEMRRGHRDEPQVVLKLAELRAQRTAIYRGNQG